MSDTRKPCVWCWYARDRKDVAGVYCTKGFENPDGTCTRFLDYETIRDKIEGGEERERISR